MQPIQQTLAHISRGIAAIGLIALMIISSLTVIDALLRRFFSSNINGLSDWVEWCMIIAVSACIPAMVWGKHAITVRVLGSIVHWRIREALESFGHLLLLLTLAIIVWQLTLYTAELYEFGDVSMLLQWKKWPVWCVATGLWGVATLLQTAIFIRQLLRVFAKTQPTAMISESLS